jgi:hypothetical protein
MRWTEYLARTGENKNAQIYLEGKPEIKKELENFGVDWRIIIKLILSSE